MKIQEQIDSATEERRALEIELAKLDTRIETLREMLEIAPDDDTPKRPRRRSLSPQWQGVLYLMLENHPDGATYDDIHAITERVGIDMKKANLRGHMGNYKASGYVKAISPGVFVLTPDGRKQATKPKEEPAEQTAGSESSGADTGRGHGFPPDNPSGSIPLTRSYQPPSTRGQGKSRAGSKLVAALAVYICGVRLSVKSHEVSKCRVTTSPN